MAKFHNPYNFIPVGERPMGKLLGQCKPVGHDRYHEDRWSGRITVEIETKTPLLIPDSANVDISLEQATKGHQTFGVRLGPDGRPLLPTTSLKGPLRAAYEAVTNSRFGVFADHNAPPARRMRGEEGGAMLPARVVKHGDGFSVELWKGRSRGWPELRVSNNNKIYYAITTGQTLEHQYAAWMPRYKQGRAGESKWASKLSEDQRIPPHGEEVFCWLASHRHPKRGFKYFSVCAGELARARHNLSSSAPAGSTVRGRGFIFASNQNAENKHDERIFFVEDGQRPQLITLSADQQDVLARRWRQLVENYQKLHEDEIRERGGRAAAARFVNAKPGKNPTPAFSRHTVTAECKKLQPGTPFDPDNPTEETGTLCYARLRMDGDNTYLDANGNPDIEGLYPVMISRELGHRSPRELLNEDYRPATKLSHLSPADRVFGWANQNGDGAYKGQLRIRSIDCEDDDAVETFDEALPLAILGTPKFSQARFYVGTANGQPLGKGADTATTAYFDQSASNQCRLRGRKVYPHHATADKVAEYWTKEGAEKDAGSPTIDEAGQVNSQPIYREYVRRRDGNTSNKDKQNRSIRSWVKPVTKFTVVIDVINLNIAEVGVLLWLLDLQNSTGVPATYHRIGGGKPLGFGSVKIAIKSVDLMTGAARRTGYRTAFAMPDYAQLPTDQRPVRGGADEAGKIVTEALTKIADETGRPNFEDHPHVAAFLSASRGHPTGLPTHYPRTSVRPDPAGKNFEWFVDNERNNAGHPLPALKDGDGLPINPNVN